MDSLYDVAFSFRNAIEQAISNGEITKLNMQFFPKGCCTYTCDLLQRFLHENGVESYEISGNFGIGFNAISHTWLELYDGNSNIVIDITGDQFENNASISFGEKVYVGVRNNGFHNRFDLDDPLPYKPYHDFFNTPDPLEDIYIAILKHMRL